METGVLFASAANILDEKVYLAADRHCGSGTALQWVCDRHIAFNDLNGY